MTNLARDKGKWRALVNTMMNVLVYKMRRMCELAEEIGLCLKRLVSWRTYVLCGSQNERRFFPYTALTDWFL